MTMAMAGLLYLGLFALAAAMQRHRKALAGPWHGPTWAPLLAPGGWMLLGLSLLLVAARWDNGLALVSWIGLLTVAGALVLMGLTYRPHWLSRGLIAAVVIVILGLILPR
jgi:hypothetical protein